MNDILRPMFSFTNQHLLIKETVGTESSVLVADVCLNYKSFDCIKFSPP